MVASPFMHCIYDGGALDPNPPDNPAPIGHFMVTEVGKTQHEETLPKPPQTMSGSPSPASLYSCLIPFPSPLESSQTPRMFFRKGQLLITRGCLALPNICATCATFDATWLGVSQVSLS